MLRYFLKAPPLKKILQFQDRICFFLLKTQKTTTIQQVPGEKTPNIILKRMLKFFQKIPPLKKILEFQNQKKDNETYKMNFTN